MRVPLALALLLCLASRALGGCNARFELVAGQAGGTNLTFSGVSKYSLVAGGRFPVKLNDPSTLIGLAGAMFASAPAACPTDAAGWRALAAGGDLQVASAPSAFFYQPLEVFPRMIYANVFRVPLNISDLAVNLTLGPPPPGAPGNVSVSAQVTQGFVFSNTSITGGPQLTPFNITRQYAGAAAVEFAEKTDGGQRWLYLTLPDFEMDFGSATSSAFRGSGSMDFGFRGRVVMRSPLGCARDCGPHGRCAAAAAGNKTAAGGCECECGWGASPADGTCSVPMGYCSIYGGAAALAAVPAAPVGAAAAAGAVPAAGASCPAGYGFSVRQQACEQCATGFGGPGCDTCTSDAACAAKTHAPGATCASGLAFAERTREKFYTCSLSDPSIASVVGNVLAFSCSTVGPNGEVAVGAGGAGKPQSAVSVDATTLIGRSPFCRIELRLGDMPPNQTAVCNGWGCHFGSGEPSWVCDTVVCECPNGCASGGQDYMETFKNVRGEVTLDCEKKTDKCLLNVGSLDIKIEADCQASECIDPEGPVLVGEAVARSKGRDWAHPVIAAIPAMVLFLGVVACGAMMAGALPYLRTAPAAGRGGGGKGDAAGAAPAGPVGEGREGGDDAAGGGAAADVAPAAAPAAGGGALKIVPAGGGGVAPVQELSWDDLVVKARLPGRGHGGRRHAPPAPASAAALAGANAAAGAAAAAPPGGVAISVGGDDKGAAGAGAAHHEHERGARHEHAAASGPAAAARLAAELLGLTAGGARWKTILHGVSGKARAREVAGILGPSGSGKSTLLSALTGSLAGDPRWRARGRVCLDGAPAGARALAAATALVPQDDLLMRSLTVEECLLYSAALRLPPALPPAAVHSKVEEVMSALKISHVRGSTVWSGAGAAAGVSGGERRRVAIGMELVTDPQVLVLDEPTSGLDSFTALNLLRTLRAVAERGHAVMLSLHQPSPVLFDAMDQVILMADGYVIYSGSPSAAAAGMAALGAPPPAGVSVAEHMLHVVSDPETHGPIVARAAAARASGGGAAQQGLPPPPAGAGAPAGGGAGALANGSGTEEASSTIVAASTAPSASVFAGKPRRAASAAPPLLSRLCGTPPPGPNAPPHAAHAHPHVPHAAHAAPRRSVRRELGVLFWRGLADMLRNPLLTAFHAVGGLVLGLLVGIIFYQVELNTTGAQNRLGAIFFGLALMAFTSVTSIDLIQAERHAAAREMRRAYYSPWSYSATKLVLDGVLLRALPALLFAVPFYFLMGLSPGAGPFMTFALVFVAFNATVGALALALAAALDSPGKTVLAMNLVLLVGVLFAGFLANKESIPAPLRWITYLSVFRYAWEAMVINELRSLYLYFTAPNVSITVSMKGTVFLDIIGVKEGMLLPDIGILVAMYAGCCTLLCFVMWWRNGARRGG